MSSAAIDLRAWPPLRPAETPPDQRRSARLFVIDPASKRTAHSAPRRLPDMLQPRDLVVLNDAATLPASFRIEGHDAELRLLGRGDATNQYQAFALGPGDFRMPTEARGAAPVFREGDVVSLGPELEAMVTRVDPKAPQLLDIEFTTDGAALLSALYRNGRPIQYAYVSTPLALWDVQNRFAGRPWAFEMASAGRAFDGELLFALARAGVGVAWLTHAAGISSTGSAALDARLPLPERFEIPEGTATAIRDARAAGGRVLAVGTTVVRALEASATRHGHVRAGSDRAELLIGPGYRPRVVHGVLSGMHEMGSSHFSLLRAFAPRQLMLRASWEAARADYRQHEFGDFCVIWRGALAPELRPGHRLR